MRDDGGAIQVFRGVATHTAPAGFCEPLKRHSAPTAEPQPQAAPKGVKRKV